VSTYYLEKIFIPIYTILLLRNIIKHSNQSLMSSVKTIESAVGYFSYLFEMYFIAHHEEYCAILKRIQFILRTETSKVYYRKALKNNPLKYTNYTAVSLIFYTRQHLD